MHTRVSGTLPINVCNRGVHDGIVHEHYGNNVKPVQSLFDKEHNRLHSKRSGDNPPFLRTLLRVLAHSYLGTLLPNIRAS